MACRLFVPSYYTTPCWILANRIAQRHISQIHCDPIITKSIVSKIIKINVQTSTSASYHYSYVIMSAMASQITCVWSDYSTVCSGADQRKHQSSAWLDFVRGIQRGPVNSPHKGPVTRKMFPFDDVILMGCASYGYKTWSLLSFTITPPYENSYVKVGRAKPESHCTQANFKAVVR